MTQIPRFPGHLPYHISSKSRSPSYLGSKQQHTPLAMLSTLPSELLGLICEFVVEVHQEDDNSIAHGLLRHSSKLKRVFALPDSTAQPGLCWYCLGKSYRQDLSALCLTSKMIAPEAQRILYRDITSLLPYYGNKSASGSCEGEM